MAQATLLGRRGSLLIFVGREHPYRSTTKTMAPLQTLLITRLEPEQVVQRTEALTTLDRIETIVVRRRRRRDKDSVYVVDLFHKQARRRIPVLSSRRVQITSACTNTRLSNSSPDRQIECSFRDIRQLRDAIYYAASADHGMASCTYCRAISDFILVGGVTPQTIPHILRRSDDQCRVLGRFLQDLLQLCTQVKSSRCETCCSGQSTIPELLSSFLAGRSDVSPSVGTI